jgi:hypothetical protein
MSIFELPYPERECRPTPSDALEQLEEELHLYPTSADLRSNIRGLIELYELHNARLLQGFRECSELLVNTSTPHGGSLSSDSDMNEDFYYGEVLAMHCLVQPQPFRLWSRILSEDPLEVVSDYNEADVTEDYEQANVLLTQFHDTFWKRLFNDLSPAAREKLKEAATQLFANEESPEKHKNSFLAGFMFANYCIET